MAVKAVLLACGLGVAICSGPVAAAGGADVSVRVEAKKIVILDCGQTKLQNELKRTLDYITDGDVKILKPAHVPPFGSFVIRLGQAPARTTEQLLEEGDETAAPRAKGGLVGLDSDGPAAGSRQHYMECWYLLKFLQDPTKDFAHWERLWCSFFGPAADDVAKYYAYWREEVWEKRFVPQLDKLDIGAAKAVYANLGRYYHEQDFVTAGAHLERGLGRADLGPVARKMLEDLKTDNEHGRIFVRAWIGRTPEQVRDLVDYRKTHGLPSHWGYEKEFLELSKKDER